MYAVTDCISRTKADNVSLVCSISTNYFYRCQTHGTDPSDESAEFYVEQTDIDQMDRQVMDDESYGVWN